MTHTPKHDLLIFPCNGNAMEALDCLSQEYNLIGFVDDVAEKQGRHVFGFPVFDRSAFDIFADAFVLAVPGSPVSYKIRKEIISGLKISQTRFAQVIHPSAQISKNSKIGYNVLIMAGVVICGNAAIHDHVVILPNTVIHHDTSVGEYSLLGSGIVLTGYSSIEENCYIGSKSSISNYVTIGKMSLIGIGSNVLKTVPESSIYAGNPAKEIMRS